jgi:hypothetical protein
MINQKKTAITASTICIDFLYYIFIDNNNCPPLTAIFCGECEQWSNDAAWRLVFF